MKRRCRKIMALVLTFVVASTCLTGCALARTEQQQVKAQEKFIGVLVTQEDDIKDYMMQEGDTLYFEKKELVRADGSIVKLTDEQMDGFNVNFNVEGKKQKDGTYQFDDIDGYYIGYSKETQKEGTSEEVQSVEIFVSDGVYHIGTHFGSHVKESNMEPIITTGNEAELDVMDTHVDKDFQNADESVKIKGTIAVSSKTDAIVRVNKVFEREDGSVYAVIPGDSSFVVDKGNGGGSWTHNTAESYETSIKGTGIPKESKKLTVEFEVTVETKDILEGALIRQLDANNNLVKVEPADFSTKDQTLKLEANTAYVIIEENFTDEGEESYIKRTTYDCERIGKQYENGYEVFASHNFFIAKENGKFGIIGLSFKR